MASTTVVAAPLQRLADDLLRLALRVDVGGVDEVDAVVERVMDDPDAVVVVAVAPEPEHHGAEALHRHLDAGLAECAGFHHCSRRCWREECEQARPCVGGRGLVIVVGSVAHETVFGVFVDDDVAGVVRFDGRDLVAWDPLVVAAEEREERALRGSEVLGDAAAVERHRGVDQRRRAAARYV